MQIFTKDSSVDNLRKGKKHFGCLSNKSAISVFFNVTGDNLLEPTGFFEDFQKTKSNDGDSSIDISKLLNLGSTLRSSVFGYIGTDTMPTCEKFVCWYVF